MLNEAGKITVYKKSCEYFIKGIFKNKGIRPAFNNTDSIDLQSVHQENQNVLKFQNMGKIFNVNINVWNYNKSKQILEQNQYGNLKSSIKITILEVNSIFYSLQVEQKKKTTKSKSMYPQICKGDDETEDQNMCDICLEEKQVDQFFKSDTCQHLFCIDCLNKKGIEDLIYCDCYIDGCRCKLLTQKLEDFVQKYNQKQQQLLQLQNENDKQMLKKKFIFTCKNCKFIQQINQNDKKQIIKCNQCKQHFCTSHQEMLEYCPCNKCPQCLQNLSTSNSEQEQRKICVSCGTQKKRNKITVLLDCIICLQNHQKMLYTQCCGQPLHKECFDINCQSGFNQRECPYCRKTNIILQNEPVWKERAETCIFESAMKEISENSESTYYGNENIPPLNF